MRLNGSSLTCARNSADDGPQSAGRGRWALANSSILRRSSREALPVTAARVTIAAGTLLCRVKSFRTLFQETVDLSGDVTLETTLDLPIALAL